MLARAEAQRVYGAATESHNECTMNTLKQHLITKVVRNTERLNLGVKQSINAFRGPRGGGSCSETITPGSV